MKKSQETGYLAILEGYFKTQDQPVVFEAFKKVISEAKPYQSFVASIVAEIDENSSMTNLKIGEVYENTLEEYIIPNSGTVTNEVKIHKYRPGVFMIHRAMKDLVEGSGEVYGNIANPDGSINNVVMFIQNGRGTNYDITGPSGHRVETYYTREEGVGYINTVDENGDYADLLFTDEEKFYPGFIEIRIYDSYK